MPFYNVTSVTLSRLNSINAIEVECPLVHWSIGPLVHWSIGPLVHWFIGPLVHLSSGPAVHWTIGTIDHSQWALTNSAMDIRLQLH